MSLPNSGMSFTPLDVLPAASLNDMVENIEALAAGTGLNDGAITPAKIANPYKFRARRNAAMSTTGGSFVKIAFDTEDFDTNNNFAGGTYTVPVSGYYQINAYILSLANPGGVMILTLYKNGVGYQRGGQIPATSAVGINYSDVIQFTAGDTIDMYVFATSSISIDVTATEQPYVSGFLVSQT